MVKVMCAIDVSVQEFLDGEDGADAKALLRTSAKLEAKLERAYQATNRGTTLDEFKVMVQEVEAEAEEAEFTIGL